MDDLTLSQAALKWITEPQAVRQAVKPAGSQEGNQAARQPGNQATRQPGSQAARQPGSQATGQPGSQAADSASGLGSCHPDSG